MPKYRVEVPIVAWLNVEVEGEDEEDASMKITRDFVYRTANGALAAKQGSLWLNLDVFSWGAETITEVE